MGRRRSGLAVALLLALVALPTVATLARGSVICARGPSDVLAQNVPVGEWLHRAVREDGLVPLWRTSQFFGAPTLGDPQQRVLYPPFYLYAVFSMPLAHHLFWLCHAWLLAAGTYALARRERSTRGAALLAGVAIGLSFKSFTYCLAGWDNIYCSVAWLPLALEGFRRETPRGEALMAACLALACLAGTPMLFAFLALGLPLPALVAARRRRGRVLGALAVGFLGGFALAAPQLLASIGASARSARAILGASYGTTFERDPIGVLFFPHFGTEDYAWEFSNALGFAALPLMGAGVARKPRSLWALLVPVFLVFAAGDATFVGRAVAKLPLVGTLSYLSRLSWLAILALVILAARGFDALWRLGSIRSRRAPRVLVGLAGGFAVLLAGALREGRVGRIKPPGWPEGAAQAALVASVVLAALVVLSPLVARAWRRRFLAAVIALTALELFGLSELALERVPWQDVTAPGEIERVLAREPLARIATVTSQSIWFDPVFPFYAAPGVERSDGYNPLHESDTERFLYSISPDAVMRRGSGFGHMYGLWAPYVGLQGVERAGFLALGTTHVLAHEPLPGLEVVARETRRFLAPSGRWTERDVFLQRVPRALPRAFVMTRARPEGDATQRLAMRRGHFDGSRTLFVDGPVAPALEGDGELLPATVVVHREERVVLHAAAPRGGGWLVLLDGYSPDWEATVDGKPAVVERADAIFRAVPIPEGPHEVVFMARAPREVWLGGALALIAVLGLAVRSRSSSGGPSPSPGGASGSAVSSAPTP